ncbi:hypothetical protein BGW38_004468 [Lunasporangiospora selenospora]|uniref:PPM-type phosphatase domain-containing protein n=1 Tax=Lunasporangiospora selenospora TaxID=979761 RepID=A0A9P6KHB7_9FUNG|nr:hypothetical protein BGW38_004468 [Lunasporangiospora selenospora]
MATTTTPFLGCCTISASARGQSPLRRCFSTLSPTLYAQPYFAIKNAKGETFRIQLSKSRELIGIRSTRCQRKYNQDRYKVLVLNPPTPSPEVAAINAASQRENSNPNKTNNGSSNNANQSQSLTKSTEGLQMDADQKSLFYFAIFDGHGGSHTADYLTAKLDQHIEEATPEMVPKVIKDLRKLGGYFRTFRPHFLEPFLPDNFEELYGSKYANKDRQPKIRIKGKGGQVKPMIFIPHPNASEEDQQQELQSLENQLGETVVLEGEGAKEEKKESKPVVMSKLTEPTVVKKEESAPKTQQRPSQNMKKTSKESATDKDFDYDEDEDPFIIAQRRALNRTSPLPGGTSSYFGTDRSEYQQLFLRHKDGGEEVGTQEGQGAQTKESKAIPNTMTLEQRLCLSFLQSDAELIRDRYQDGSTASVVIVQSKGAFWDTTEDLDLILAHVGDTRILLCEAPRGESIQLTTDHHPDASVETDRIRKMAAYVSADSFGENRFLGQLANTRALGDIASKPYGVSSEPELIRRTVKAKEAAFLVLMSDGITGVMSNQEVVDCIKLEESPTLAAANVLNLAEQLGAEDNCTIMVVKLPAWGTPMPDLSKELREYRWQNEAEQARARRR